MASVSLLGSTFNTTSGTHTVTATPAVGDLIFIVVANTGNATSTAPTDNATGGTYTRVNTALKNVSADLLEIWVRDNLITSASSTIFTDAPGTTTGGGLAVIKVTGTLVGGISAVRQSAVQANQAVATPAPVFGKTPLSGNPIIGALFTTATTAQTQRTGYTELVDTSYTTPSTEIEIMSLNSGETSATITWGSAVASAFSDIAVEVMVVTVDGTLDQHQDSTGTNFGFGQFANVRYRGQNFTPSSSANLVAIGFDRVLGSTDIKVYIDTTTSNFPTNAVGSELYSFTITNANLFNGYGIYNLPVPLALTSGTEYCFYLAPFSSGSYTDDYQDLHGINTTPGGKEDTNTNGTWSNETLTLHFSTYMKAASAATAKVLSLLGVG